MGRPMISNTETEGKTRNHRLSQKSADQGFEFRLVSKFPVISISRFIHAHTHTIARTRQCRDVGKVRNGRNSKPVSSTPCRVCQRPSTNWNKLTIVTRRDVISSSKLTAFRSGEGGCPHSVTTAAAVIYPVVGPFLKASLVSLTCASGASVPWPDGLWREQKESCDDSGTD
jgi:hypothetical protein